MGILNTAQFHYYDTSFYIQSCSLAQGRLRRRRELWWNVCQNHYRKSQWVGSWGCSSHFWYVQLLRLQLKAYDTCMLLYIAVESRAVTETSNSLSSGAMVGVVIAFSITCAALVFRHWREANRDMSIYSMWMHFYSVYCGHIIVNPIVCAWTLKRGFLLLIYYSGLCLLLWDHPYMSMWTRACV